MQCRSYHNAPHTFLQGLLKDMELYNFEVHIYMLMGVKVSNNPPYMSAKGSLALFEPRLLPSFDMCSSKAHDELSCIL